MKPPPIGLEACIISVTKHHRGLNVDIPLRWSDVRRQQCSRSMSNADSAPDAQSRRLGPERDLYPISQCRLCVLAGHQGRCAGETCDRRAIGSIERTLQSCSHKCASISCKYVPKGRLEMGKV